MNYPVVPIHKNLEYIQKTCDLINSEWKRSDTARMRSLNCSSDHLPVSLILLNENNVIGHAKLSKIPSINDACYLESVVIQNNLRGKGFGSYLMKKVENYAKNSLKLNFIYLSTKGQEIFYQKLGYVECKPVNIYGGPVLNNTFNYLPQTVNNKTFMCKDINK